MVSIGLPPVPIEELTGNVTHARGLDHFTEGLATVYQRMTEALSREPRWPSHSTTTSWKLIPPLGLPFSIPD